MSTTTAEKTATRQQPATLNGFARRKERSKEEIRKAAFDCSASLAWIG